MRYVHLGTTGVQVSELCLGTMTFGREADRGSCEAIYRRCRDAGVNFIDCANAYGQGRAEEILGELMQGERNGLVLTTKVGQDMGAGPNACGLSRRHILEQCGRSLKRLKTDWIDIYFVHRFDPMVPIEETLSTLDRLVKDGKVRYVGVSNWAAWQTAKAHGISTLRQISGFRVMQPMYNLLKRQAEVELLPLARDAGMGVMTYSPLGGGLLSGKYGVNAASTAGRLSESEMYQKRYAQPWMFTAADGLRQVAAETGYSPVSLAVAWVGHHPGVTCPIIGARNLEQLEPALEAVSVPMDDELYARIAALSPSPQPATDRSEEMTGDMA